jgi:hypothetical protein
MTNPPTCGSNERQSFHIYVDDSSKAEAYFGVGAVFCRRDAAQELKRFIDDAVVRHRQRPEKEIHWSELKGHLLPLYSEVGTKLIAWAGPRRPKIRYRALIMESRLVDRKLDPNANGEDLMAKFMFTLLRDFARQFGEHVDYHVFIDSPTGDETGAAKLFYSLNNECAHQLGFKRQPFQTVKFVLSHKVRGIQAADLITGAIAYETNRLHVREVRSKHKQQLWSDMLAASALGTFAKPTRYYPQQFQIWHFDVAKSKSTRFGTS